MKKIEGFNNYYVTTCGKIFSFKFCKFKELKTFFSDSGYKRVCIYTPDGAQKKVFIHRVIAETFIENKEKKEQVNHKNGIKTDNYVKNLEWLTASENTKHAWDNKKMSNKKGRNGMSLKKDAFMLTEEKVLLARKLRKTGKSFKEISKEMNVPITTITRAIKGQTWKNI